MYDENVYYTSRTRGVPIKCKYFFFTRYPPTLRWVFGFRVVKPKWFDPSSETGFQVEKTTRRRVWCECVCVVCVCACACVCWCSLQQNARKHMFTTFVCAFCTDFKTLHPAARTPRPYIWQAILSRQCYVTRCYTWVKKKKKNNEQRVKNDLDVARRRDHLMTRPKNRFSHWRRHCIIRFLV